MNVDWVGVASIAGFLPLASCRYSSGLKTDVSEASWSSLDDSSDKSLSALDTSASSLDIF